jgi:hypothetical protein
MNGHYRKPVNSLLQDIMLETNKRLCLRGNDKYCEVYNLETNDIESYTIGDEEIELRATTLARLYVKLMNVRLSLSVDSEDSNDSEAIEDREFDISELTD